MECIRLSERAKLHSEVSQLVDLLFSSVSFGQREPFCGCGFVSLLWLRHIIKRRPCFAAWADASSPRLCERGPLRSHHKRGLSRVFEKQFGRKPYCLWRKVVLHYTFWLLACAHFLLSPSWQLQLTMTALLQSPSMSETWSPPLSSLLTCTHFCSSF